jgi:hypothetical protein
MEAKVFLIMAQHACCSGASKKQKLIETKISQILFSIDKNRVDKNE